MLEDQPLRAHILASQQRRLEEIRHRPVEAEVRGLLAGIL
jgi:hypothetical protein